MDFRFPRPGSLGWLAAAVLTTCMTLTAQAAPEVTDADISWIVARHLHADPAVPGETIDATTSQGVVTLTGTAGTLLARERAVRLAEAVRGVRAVIDRIDVRSPVSPTAAQLRQSVENELLFDAATDSYEIDVVADESGRVTLTGAVDSWTERDLAETVAKNVVGVTRVDNRLTLTLAGRRTDQEIASDVRQRLHWDALIDDAKIKVAVDGGVVTLSGTVASAAEKRRARTRALVEGATVVHADDLQVTGGMSAGELRKSPYPVRSEEEIRAAVLDALRLDPRVAAFSVTPRVERGLVTLEGGVDNLRAKEAAGSDARHTVGVRLVVNRIKVKPRADMSDTQIAANVAAALIRDALVDARDIAVTSVNGVVWLRGSVEDPLDKVRAEDIAYRANGVVGVRNLLDVELETGLAYSPYVDDVYDFGWLPGTMVSRKQDWQIEDQINSEMFWSPFVDADEVTVVVDDGVATLTGTVDSINEYNAATENALEGGAWRVENRLVIN